MIRVINPIRSVQSVPIGRERKFADGYSRIALSPELADLVRAESSRNSLSLDAYVRRAVDAFKAVYDRIERVRLEPVRRGVVKRHKDKEPLTATLGELADVTTAELLPMKEPSARVMDARVSSPPPSPAPHPEEHSDHAEAAAAVPMPEPQKLVKRTHCFICRKFYAADSNHVCSNGIDDGPLVLPILKDEPIVEEKTERSPPACEDASPDVSVEEATMDKVVELINDPPRPSKRLIDLLSRHIPIEEPWVECADQPCLPIVTDGFKAVAKRYGIKPELEEAERAALVEIYGVASTLVGPNETVLNLFMTWLEYWMSTSGIGDPRELLTGLDKYALIKPDPDMPAWTEEFVMMEANS